MMVKVIIENVTNRGEIQSILDETAIIQPKVQVMNTFENIDFSELFFDPPSKKCIISKKTYISFFSQNCIFDQDLTEIIMGNYPVPE